MKTKTAFTGRYGKIALGLAAVIAVAGGSMFMSAQLASNEVAKADVHTCEVTGEALQSIVPTPAPMPVSDITFIKANGSEATLDDYKGRGIVLNFWATWCAPCVREMPELDRLKAELDGDGISVLALSTDRGGHNAINGFYERTNVEHLDALHDPKGVASRALGVRGLPTTLIINPDGMEVARIQGIHHYDTAETKEYLRGCIGAG